MQEFILLLQHHWELSSLFMVLLGLLFIVELIRSKNGAGGIDASQLTQLLNHQNAHVIDLRSTAEFEAGHIIGATSLPYSQFSEQSKKLDKMKARPIVLVCAKGIESLKLAHPLKKQGYSIYVLAGGMAQWIHADMPLVNN